LLVLLAGASGASAATDRYASPTGVSTNPCTQASPCDIATAVNDASTGDDITIEPGTYGSATAPLADTLIDNGYTLTIHGEAGQPRPVIYTDLAYGIVLDGPSTVSDLELIDSYAGSYAYGIYAENPDTPASIDHVLVETSGPASNPCYPDGPLIDSVCWTTGTDGIGVTLLVPSNVSAALDNDTVIASGTGGVAVKADPESSATMTIDMSNTIARGAGYDIYVGAPSGGTATITADHSNYATIENAGGMDGGTTAVTPAGSGTNQTATPVFADAATGNFHELPGSPTIDAGADSSANGTTDLDGNPRELAGQTDIGAYELGPPPACAPLTATTDFGTPAAVQLECTDPAGAALTYALAGNPAHGTVSLYAATGAVVYTPAAGYSGPDSFSYTATAGDGTAAPATVSLSIGAAPVPPPPILSSASQAHRTWAEHAAKKGKKPKHKPPPVGTSFTFTLSEPADVTLAFAQQAPGRKATHGRCAAPTRKNRHEHACTRTLSAGTETISGTAGKNTFTFSGRIPGHKTLSSGKYTVTITAANAGGRSRSQNLTFTIDG
jgi:hypothetical protein